MTSLEKRIQDELIKRFNANNWNTITLNMKAVGTMTITPESDVRKIHDAKDIDLYNIDIHINGLDQTFTNFAFSLEHLTSIVADFEKDAEITKKTVKDLKTYYEKHIKGHTQEELNLGNDIFSKLYSMSSNICELLENEHLVEKAIKKVSVTDLEKGKHALELRNHWNTYSDGYKSIYDHRPTF